MSEQAANYVQVDWGDGFPSPIENNTLTYTSMGGITGYRCGQCGGWVSGPHRCEYYGDPPAQPYVWPVPSVLSIKRRRVIGGIPT